MGSSTLWSILNQDWEGRYPNKLSFGSSNFFWGEKVWVDNGMVESFWAPPESLTKISDETFPGIYDGGIVFVAIGAQGSWVMGSSKSHLLWSGIDQKFESTIKRELAAGNHIKVCHTLYTYHSITTLLSSW